MLVAKRSDCRAVAGALEGSRSQTLCRVHTGTLPSISAPSASEHRLSTSVLSSVGARLKGTQRSEHNTALEVTDWDFIVAVSLQLKLWEDHLDG